MGPLDRPMPEESWNLIAVVVATGIFFAAYVVMQRYGNRAKNMRAALLTLGGVPLLAYGLTVIAFQCGHPVAVARTVFVALAVLLPPSLFFLFVATRRESLFNQYTASLDRLGLLRPRQLRVADVPSKSYTVEDTARLRRRVRGYLDRFSAVYGALPQETVVGFLDSLDGTLKGDGAHDGWITGDPFSSFELKTVLPVFACSALICLGWVMVLPPFPDVPHSAALAAIETPYNGGWYLWAAEPVLIPASFAFLGAYFISVQMLVKRFLRRDLGPNVYNVVSMRIILATLAVWVAVQCLDLSPKPWLSPGMLFALSFAVGAFPLIVWQLLSNAIKRLPVTTVMLPNLEGTAPLAQIDGLSVWHEARLDEEDIENVPNLATADIADLMLSTKIVPNRIIDWVDQAILIMVRPPRPSGSSGKSWIGDTFSDYGIRTASTLVAATESRGSAPPLVDQFSTEHRQQAIALAASVRLCPNYPLVRNWLGTAPTLPWEEAPLQQAA